jgi:predicted double-glycine peptidase
VKERLKAFFLLFLLLPVSCSTASGVRPDGTVIRGVPFFSQEAYQCGPAALATVMNYWHEKTGKGTQVTPEQIAADIYSPTARGVLGFDLERYARGHGFQTEQYEGSMGDLRRRVDEGTPLIVFVDYGFSLYQVNHFMVVKGYVEGGVVVNSGKRENQTVPEGTLEKAWKKNRYWTLLLKPLP